MLITIKWQAADTMPAIMHHLSGNGNIAYGTNTMNKTYQTRYSRLENPTPSPINPVTEIAIYNFVDLQKFSMIFFTFQSFRFRHEPCKLSNNHVHVAAQCK